MRRLLQRLFPNIHGFKNTLLGQLLGFDILHNGFIQMLYTSLGHWVTASTMGCLQEILLYDSMPPAMRENLKRQICALLCTPLPTIIIR